MSSDRADAIERAEELLRGDLVVFDTETTGIGATDEIVEISVISARGDTLLDTLVRPTAPIPEGARAIHGIGDEDVVGAPTIVELLPDLQRLLANQTVIAYNLKFDTWLLNQSCKARGIEWPFIGRDARRSVIKGTCAMKLYAQYYGAWSEWHGSYTWQSLGNALAQCGLTVEGPLHRALSDARAALAVLNYIAGSPSESAAQATSENA